MINGMCWANALCLGTQMIEAASCKAFSVGARLEDILKAVGWPWQFHFPQFSHKSIVSDSATVIFHTV